MRPKYNHYFKQRREEINFFSFLLSAVEKALHFIDKDELPPHWDRELLFGLLESDINSDSDDGLDSDVIYSIFINLIKFFCNINFMCLIINHF